MKNNYLLALIILIFTITVSDSYAKGWKAKHVIWIGLDGWGSFSMKNADMPNVKNLMDEGSYTLKKRSVLPSSSGVNWATMFMGACPELHGYAHWNSNVPDFPSRVINEHGIFPTVFSVLKKNYPDSKIGCISEWGNIFCLVDTLALDYALYTSYITVDSASQYIKNEKPTLLFTYFGQPDHVGHDVGFDTPEYYSVLKQLDVYIGQIVQAVKDAGIYDETIIVVTSDHGGVGKGHGKESIQELETPFIMCGKNIKKNNEIQEYMMQFDVASTIAYIFDLEQPQVWIGRPAKSAFK